MGGIYIAGITLVADIPHGLSASIPHVVDAKDRFVDRVWIAAQFERQYAMCEFVILKAVAI